MAFSSRAVKVNDYEYWSTFAEVIIKIKVARIFLRHGVDALLLLCW